MSITTDTEATFAAFVDALLAMDRLAVRQLLTPFQGVERRMEAIERLVVPALEQIGWRWEEGELSLAQVYMSGRICEELVEELLPAAPTERPDQPTLGLAILEDHHMLGKRMVAAVLRAGGYRFHDYGQVDVERLVALVLQDRIDVLLVSVLMLPSALRVAELMHQLAQLNQRPRVVVGGAPFRLDAQLWQEVGADAMGRSAADVLHLLHGAARRSA
ncbi:cobalamin B12-binding domain-containing protein [Candidatus Viridilinea mediisalina]|uniref:Cobalamin-binding protein n=1 Tax=Candidatus Viridilinea mediisalina TaxID=2024553 RepID=A0A2A6RLN6_9CHLR|nr:cobalamin-dependent protein [Candidatus Viridilinea mediisalina]PDW03821.1 cobalamin-binding protein [Candidatus Viridilinea mediisalina]